MSGQSPKSGEESLFGGGGGVGEVMGSWDWSSSAVGAPTGWSSALRQVVQILLSSRFSMWMGWGPELTVFYNDAYRRDTLQAKHPWALGRPAEQVWAEIWDDIGPRIASVLHTGQATWDEALLLFLERAGYVEETYHTFSYSPLREDNGHVAGFLCVVSEDTARVLGERRLRILSELGDISAVNAPTVPAACAAALEVLARHRLDVPFGSVYLLEPGEQRAYRAGFFGMVDDPTIVPEVIDRAALPDAPLWPMLATGHPQVLEGLDRDFPGMFVPMPPPMDTGRLDSVLAVPLAGIGGGAPVGLLFAGISPLRALDADYRRFIELVAGQVGTSIADAQAYQAQLRRAAELAELDRAKTEFFTGVSHELRTPLTLIAGPAQDALDDPGDPLPARQRERLELIQRNSGRLRRLIDTLLEFSRIEGGQLRPELVATELAEFTRGIAESFAPAAARAGLELVIDCPELPTAMLVDLSMWEKIVLNLLSNAVKYTVQGTITVRLRASDDGRVRLIVSDTGIGIPPDDLGRVFDRFHRVRHDHMGGEGVGRSIEGTGIGLALVSELAALHAGTATVSSTLGAGSRFAVELPATARTELPARPGTEQSSVALFLDEALQWTQLSPGAARDGEAHTEMDRALDGARPGKGVHSGAGTTAGGCVLVVEDNTDLRSFVAGLLRVHYRVLVAGDGKTALDIARRDRVDLVLTDVMMPVLDGFELLTALRADPATAGLPVILLSARAGQEAVNHGLAAGADDYLVKPFSSTDLLARVRSNMELARLRNHESARRAAMVNSLQDGFYLQDVSSAGAIIEINPAMTDLLGLRPDDLPVGYPFPFWPTPDEDPQAHDAFRRRYADATAAGAGRGVVALRHVSTRATVWVSLSYSSFTDLDGQRQLIVGTMRDVTGAHLAEQRAGVLAETGRLVAEPGDRLIPRLRRLVESAVSVLGQIAFVALRGPDGLHQVVVAAHSTDPGLADEFLTLPPHRVPDQLADHYRSGRGYVIDHLDEAWLRSFAAADPEQFLASWRSRVRGGLAVPLVVAGRALGSLGFVTDDDAGFTPTDLGFAEELARRVAAIVDTDQVAARELQLHQASGALAAAASLRQTSDALGFSVADALGTSGVSVFIIHPEDLAHLRLEHDHGMGPHFADEFRTISVNGHFLICQVARTGEPVWLNGQRAHQERLPHPAEFEQVRDAHAVAVLPLRLGARTLGALALTFPTTREFPPEERQFAMTLVGQAAQAIERAALADTHTRIAATLQTSLLPATLPALPRLAVATHYQPAGWQSQAGGDWYDVITLDDHRVAIVVGDVVGNGAAAAAIMGQLRSALAAHLIENHPPGAAITMLNHFAHHVDAALGSTVICLELHTGTGELRWASAGHPPPLLITPDETRYLAGGSGIVLGANPTATYQEGHTTLAPGSSIVLYTDGLVERRREIIDDGLDRLAAATSAHYDIPAAALLSVALTGCLPPGGTTDDVALIVARLLPPPLDLHLPARPEQLRPLRRAIRAWATQNALSQDTLDDLTLAVSEAAENCIEHAYPTDPAGQVHLYVEHQAGGPIHVQVTDDGNWRPPPADPGHRGRGLQVIDTLSDALTIGPSQTGTSVTFTLAPPSP